MFWFNLFKWLFGEEAAHKLTSYQYWKVPAAENLEPPRVTSVREPGETIPWSKDLGSRKINFRTKPHSDGRVSGRPMQMGKSTVRTISWGYLEWGQKFKAQFPNPLSGWYWRTGHPLPSFDRHCIVKEPNATKKIFHETIQLDPNVDPNSVFSNNALGWGLWEDGKLVDGRATTATKEPAHVYIWTPWSKQNPHECSVVVDNYEGADGTLKPGEGVRAGADIILPKTSQSYIKMVQKGGECYHIAQALATRGAKVIDRQIDSQDRVDDPTLEIQPGSQWADTNIGELEIVLGDFVYAK